MVPYNAGKSQNVRLIDVFALGPFMVWAATQKTLPKWAQVALVVSGILTITYNADNYRKVAQNGAR